MADLTLYLLRHGESLANVKRVFAVQKEDLSLSEAGVKEASGQADLLKTIGFGCIYTSPLLRARQTANILAQKLSCTVVVSDSLTEVNVGVLDGKSQDSPRSQALYKSVLRGWELGHANLGFPNGETLSEVERRFGGFLDGVESKEEKCVLVIGHCLLFMAVLWLFCENRNPYFEGGHMQRGHLSIIRRSDSLFLLLRWNLSPKPNAHTNPD